MRRLEQDSAIIGVVPAILAGILLGCSYQPRCWVGLCERQPDRPDLRFVLDTLTFVPRISFHEVWLTNVGPVTGDAKISITVADTAGSVLLEATLRGGDAVRIPAAHLGGQVGRVIEFSRSGALVELLDSLRGSNIPFVMYGRIATVGGDAFEADNSAERSWRPWTKLTPGSQATVPIGFDITRKTQVRLESVRVPADVEVEAVQIRDGQVFAPGSYFGWVKVRSPQGLAIGSTYVLRSTLLDNSRRSVIRRVHHIAVYDTVAPRVTGYRVVILEDGRIAIQIRAGDEHSGISEVGVQTGYSLDGGRTWRRKRHDSIEDDFGRPAIFDGVIGPFASEDTVVIKVEVQDAVGNVSDQLPDDAVVLAAPRRAEILVDSLATDSPNGHPIFRHQEILRHAAWTQYRDTASDRPRMPEEVGASPSDRFESRRIQELRTIPAVAEKWGIRLQDFVTLEANVAGYYVTGGKTRLVLRIQGGGQ